MKCFHCKDKMEEINVNAVVWAGLGDTEEKVRLWACLSRDCSNRGVVMAIPTTAKED